MLWALQAFDSWLIEDDAERPEPTFSRRRVSPPTEPPKPRSERKGLTWQLERVDEKPEAKVIVLGQSTMGQWLTPSYLSRMLGVRDRDVLDAHLGGCHPDCTWAEVRRLKAKTRRFDTAFFGLNLYQMCDQPSWKRSMQHVSMTPPDSTLDLYALYAQSKDPLEHVGQHAGMHVLLATQDPVYVRAKLADALSIRNTLGHRSPSWWRDEKAPVRVDPEKRRGWLPTCDYEKDSLGGKPAFVAALLDELSAISSRTFLLVLPDRLLLLPEHQSAWQKHRELMASLAAEREHVSLIDLATDGARHWNHFRDAVHVAGRGRSLQRQLFVRRLKELDAL